MEKNRRHPYSLLTAPERARQELGDHIDQKGSMVSPERLRFDFSHGKPLEAGALARIEATCRGQLLDALRIYARDVPLAEARQINGARAAQRCHVPVQLALTRAPCRPPLSETQPAAAAGRAARVRRAAYPADARQYIDMVQVQKQLNMPFMQLDSSQSTAS